MLKRKNYLKPALGKAAPNSLEAELKRINALAKTARTNWFWVLGYLASVFLVFLSVRDADLILSDASQVKLPFVGLEVSFWGFFASAPFIGIAITLFFHFHLLKLWKAISKLPTEIHGRPLSEHIDSSMITDMALGYRGDGTGSE